MARARTIKAAELFDEVHIDLWGSKFRLKDMTRSLEKQASEEWERLENSDDTVEAALPQFLEFMETLTEPIADDSGKKTKVKTIVKRELEADNIGYGHVIALAGQIMSRGTEPRPI
jgi:hypothetical protein